MLVLEKVRQIITDCQFPPDLKKRLILVLPNLDKYTVTGLGKEVSRGDSLPIAESLTERWENFARLLEGFKKRVSNPIVEFFRLFSEMQNTLNEDEKFYFLNLVMDVRLFVSGFKTNFSSKQYEDILEYEISLFWYLPKEEVMFFLQNELLFLASKVDLLGHIKSVTWDNDWDYTKGFSKTFSNLLSQNKEILGNQTVGAWVQGYFNFSSASSFRKDVVQVAEFLVKDPLVQKLSNEEKKILSDILKLYVWFLEPEINEDEVLNYKEQIREKEAELFAQLFEQETKSIQPIKTPPVVPAPKNAPSFRPMEDVEVQKPEVGMSDNKKAAPFGAALGSQVVPDRPVLTSEYSIADAGKNQKPQLSQGNLVDSNTMREKSGLLSTKSLSQSENLVNSGFSSGGREGNRTPRVMDSKPDSAPHPAHSNELYQNNNLKTNNADNLGIGSTPRRVNIQDILRSKDEESRGGNQQPGVAGFGMRDEGEQISNNKFQISNGETKPNLSNFAKASSDKSSLNKTEPPVSPPKTETVDKTKEIDRKLEELGKRIEKNN